MRDFSLLALSRPSTNRSGPFGKRQWAIVLAVLYALLGAKLEEARAQRAVWAATPVNQTNGTTVKMPLKRTVSRSSERFCFS
jgi:hypothetical protein